MNPARIEVFCRRPVRGVHRHPDIHMVNKHASTRPHLAQPHEHSLVVTVWARCPSPDRFVDLLDLQNILDKVTERRVINFDCCSFEQMCHWFYQWFNKSHRICRVRVEADQIEGATLEWEVE